MELISRSLGETVDFASKILAELVNKKRANQATLVALQGDLGAGKTTFTQAVARALGITDRVTSPTFVIMKTHQISCQGTALPSGKAVPWGQLVHIDCYRLESQKDLLQLGWNEIVADSQNLILVEWPERVGALISSPTLKIKFEVTGENSRKIIYG